MTYVHIKMTDQGLEVILETIPKLEAILPTPHQQAEPNQLIVLHKKIDNQ